MIEFKNVEISYGDFVAISNLNLDIKEGEFFTFLGPSGCGKTTTLRALVGFNIPTGGQSISDGTSERKAEHFDDFVAAYTAEDRRAVKDERWSVFTRDEITAKGNSLDLGLIRDDSVLDYNELPDPVESAEEAVANLEEAVDLLMSVVKELKSLQSAEVE